MKLRTFQNLVTFKDQYPIMASLPDDAEGALTLCAAVESLTEPITVFIRLAESKGGFNLESTQ